MSGLFCSHSEIAVLQPVVVMPEPVPFLFVGCQVGVEKTLKQELLTKYPGLRFAFSRPGFMTFKVTDPAIRPGEFRPSSVFARVFGWTVDKVTAESADDLPAMMAERIRTLPDVGRYRYLHCWQRDTTAPGRNWFEPGISPVAREAANQLDATPTGSAGTANQRNQRTATTDAVRGDCGTERMVAGLAQSEAPAMLAWGSSAH
ncbi:MAG: hypothetical protein R3C49_13940 [Planctomycetaceae bacterium]